MAVKRVFAKGSGPQKPKAYLIAGDAVCDAPRCSAQAYVRVTFRGGSELEFCKHHANRYEATYLPLATAVLDESDRIPQAPHKVNPS